MTTVRACTGPQVHLLTSPHVCTPCAQNNKAHAAVQHRSEEQRMQLQQQVERLQVQLLQQQGEQRQVGCVCVCVFCNSAVSEALFSR